MLLSLLHPSRNSILCLIWISAIAWGNLHAAEQVFIPRAWHNVKELLAKAEEQTGVVLRLEVEDGLGKMVLYDNLTDLPSVREAAREYFTYVLGKNVIWSKQGREWVLCEVRSHELPTATDLLALEDLWAKKIPEHKTMPSDNPTIAVSDEKPIDPEQMEIPSAPNVLSMERMETSHLPVTVVDSTQNGSESLADRASSKSSAPPWKEDVAPETEVSRSWWARAIFMMEKWWDGAGELERDELRRLWKNSDAMGRVPLMYLVLSGKMDFSMGAEVSLADLHQRSEDFSMCPIESTFLEPRDELELVQDAKLPVDPIEHEPTENFKTQDDAQSLENIKASWKMPVWHWPSKILSFSPKNWWQVLMGERIQHPEERVVPEPSQHVLNREAQARRVFEKTRDMLMSKRSESRPRRERE